MSRALAVLGAIALVLGAALLYARAELFDPDSLAAHAGDALADENVREALSPTIVAAIARVSPEGAPSERQVEQALADPRVAGTFEAAAGLAARQLFERDAGAFDLELGDVAETSVGAIGGVSAEDLGISAGDLESARLELIESRAVLDALELAEQAGWIGLILTPLGALALLLSVAMARERPSAISFAGVAVAVVALLLAAAVYVGREIVLAQFDDSLTQDAVSAAWGALLGDLLVGSFIVAGAGALVALLAALLGSRGRPAYPA